MTTKQRNLSGNYKQPKRVLTKVTCVCGKIANAMIYPANKTRMKFIPSHKKCKHKQRIKEDKARWIKQKIVPKGCKVVWCKDCKFRLTRGKLKRPCQVATFEPITNEYDYDLVNITRNEVEEMVVG